MKFEIYHQLGYRYQWNLESINKHNTGDGIILSPKHMGEKNLSTLKFNKNKTIYDPQFFQPNQAKRKLDEFSFFPCLIIKNFAAGSYGKGETQKIAESCIQYQINNQFEYLTIPARLYGNNPTDYIQEQERLFINPFRSVLEQSKNNRKIILQVVINKNFILDRLYFDEILNWITSLKIIDGIYLIIQTDYKSKQIEDIDFLFGLLKFVDILTQLNDLIVILGYTNLDAVLLSLSDPDIITIGSYENTRRFNIENFHVRIDGEKQEGPTPRIYMSKLIQLVDYRYINSIMTEFGDSIFDHNDYQTIMFQSTYKWNFQKPEPYRHFFLEFSKQLRFLSTLQLSERYFAVKDMLTSAITNYELLEKTISFDRNSKGSHLPIWLTVANRFAKQKGWI